MKLATLSFGIALAFARPAWSADATRPASGRPVEICFVLDTTGSMGGLIDGAKRKIWSIANAVLTRQPRPRSLHIALLPFRDRGDVYVTKVFDLTDDIDTVYKNLQTFVAAGGGDTPESVNQALDEAVEKVSWSRDDDVLKVVFLVGDAPPHMDYPDDVKYPDVCRKAARRNVIFNTVQCGSAADTTAAWQDIARRAEGSYIHVGQDGGGVTVATPVDAELATLNRRMGRTLVPFGVAGPLAAAAGAAQAAKQMASEAAAAPAVAADRLSFNLNSGKAVQGDDELVDAVAAKRVALKDLNDDQLPADWRAMSRADRAKRIERLTADRAAIRDQIADASKRRDAFLAAGRLKRADAARADGFDVQVTRIISDEASRAAK